MAAEKRGIYFGRMLNLLVSTFHPRTERDFPSNNPQPIENTAFLRRIYFGRACHHIKTVDATGFSPVASTVSGLSGSPDSELPLLHRQVCATRVNEIDKLAHISTSGKRETSWKRLK